MVIPAHMNFYLWVKPVANEGETTEEVLWS